MVLPRFYPILDTEVALRRGIDPTSAARQILEGGAKILQFRHKGFLSREAFAWLEQIAEVTRAAGATLVVNDRADLAKLFGAALHLGQDDLLPSVARRVIGTDAIVGYSTHNEAQLRAASRSDPSSGPLPKRTPILPLAWRNCAAYGHSRTARWWR
jgi:thiamine-phosphate pyrophosphorylase